MQKFQILLDINFPKMLILLNVLNHGKIKSIASNWILINPLSHWKIGKNSKELSRKPNALSLKKKFKKAHWKTRDPRIS